jgi:hypothetical protein
MCNQALMSFEKRAGYEGSKALGLFEVFLLPPLLTLVFRVVVISIVYPAANGRFITANISCRVSGINQQNKKITTTTKAPTQTPCSLMMRGQGN